MITSADRLMHLCETLDSGVVIKKYPDKVLAWVHVPKEKAKEDAGFSYSTMPNWDHYILYFGYDYDKARVILVVDGEGVLRYLSGVGGSMTDLKKNFKYVDNFIRSTGLVKRVRIEDQDDAREVQELLIKAGFGKHRESQPGGVGVGKEEPKTPEKKEKQ